MPYAKLGDPQTLNLYSYVGNNPVLGTDADGHTLTLDQYHSALGAMGGPQMLDGGSASATADSSYNGYPDPSTSTPQTTNGTPAQQTSGQTPANDAPGKQPIVVPNATALVGQKVFGSGTCVDLAKAYGAPQTSQWTPGPAPDANTPKGTLVATFYSDNGTKFANQSGFSHVGAFNGTFEKTNGKGVTTTGIVLIDQYKGRSQIDFSNITTGGTRNYNSNASNYRIVLVPKKEDQ